MVGNTSIYFVKWVFAYVWNLGFGKGQTKANMTATLLSYNIVLTSLDQFIIILKTLFSFLQNKLP